MTDLRYEEHLKVGWVILLPNKEQVVGPISKLYMMNETTLQYLLGGLRDHQTVKCKKSQQSHKEEFLIL